MENCWLQDMPPRRSTRLKEKKALFSSQISRWRTHWHLHTMPPSAQETQPDNSFELQSPEIEKKRSACLNYTHSQTDCKLNPDVVLDKLPEVKTESDSEFTFFSPNCRGFNVSHEVFTTDHDISELDTSIALQLSSSISEDSDNLLAKFESQTDMSWNKTSESGITGKTGALKRAKQEDVSDSGNRASDGDHTDTFPMSSIQETPAHAAHAMPNCSQNMKRPKKLHHSYKTSGLDNHSVGGRSSSSNCSGMNGLAHADTCTIDCTSALLRKGDEKKQRKEAKEKQAGHSSTPQSTSTGVQKSGHYVLQRGSGSDQGKLGVKVRYVTGARRRRGPRMLACRYCADFKTRDCGERRIHVAKCHSYHCTLCYHRFCTEEELHTHKVDCEAQCVHICVLCQKSYHKARQLQHFHSQTHREHVRVIRDAFSQFRLNFKSKEYLSNVTCHAVHACQICHPAWLHLNTIADAVGQPSLNEDGPPHDRFESSHDRLQPMEFDEANIDEMVIDLLELCNQFNLASAVGDCSKWDRKIGDQATHTAESSLGFVENASSNNFVENASSDSFADSAFQIDPSLVGTCVGESGVFNVPALDSISTALQTSSNIENAEFQTNMSVGIRDTSSSSSRADSFVIISLQNSSNFANAQFQTNLTSTHAGKFVNTASQTSSSTVTSEFQTSSSSENSQQPASVCINSSNIATAELQLDPSVTDSRVLPLHTSSAPQISNGHRLVHAATSTVCSTNRCMHNGISLVSQTPNNQTARQHVPFTEMTRVRDLTDIGESVFESFSNTDMQTSVNTSAAVSDMSSEMALQKTACNLSDHEFAVDGIADYNTVTHSSAAKAVLADSKDFASVDHSPVSNKNKRDDLLNLEPSSNLTEIDPDSSRIVPLGAFMCQAFLALPANNANEVMALADEAKETRPSPRAAGPSIDTTVLGHCSSTVHVDSSGLTIINPSDLDSGCEDSSVSFLSDLLAWSPNIAEFSSSQSSRNFRRNSISDIAESSSNQSTSMLLGNSALQKSVTQNWTHHVACGTHRGTRNVNEDSQNESSNVDSVPCPFTAQTFDSDLMEDFINLVTSTPVKNQRQADSKHVFHSELLAGDQPVLPHNPFVHEDARTVYSTGDCMPTGANPLLPPLSENQPESVPVRLLPPPTLEENQETVLSASQSALHTVYDLLSPKLEKSPESVGSASQLQLHTESIHVDKPQCGSAGNGTKNNTDETEAAQSLLDLTHQASVSAEFVHKTYAENAQKTKYNVVPTCCATPDSTSYLPQSATGSISGELISVTAHKMMICSSTNTAKCSPENYMDTDHAPTVHVPMRAAFSQNFIKSLDNHGTGFASSQSNTGSPSLQDLFTVKATGSEEEVPDMLSATTAEGSSLQINPCVCRHQHRSLY